MDREAIALVLVRTRPGQTRSLVEWSYGFHELGFWSTKPNFAGTLIPVTSPTCKTLGMLPRGDRSHGARTDMQLS